MDIFVLPDNLDNTEKEFLQKLEVDENDINIIEAATWEQSNSERWRRSVNIDLQLQNFILVRGNHTMKCLQRISSTRNHSLQGM